MLYFQDGEKNLSYTALRPEYADLTDKPAILLLSPHSASGAELFAGAIRDYGAGIAVGQRTFGKGIAQLVFDTGNAEGFAEGEALKITAYRFYSPDGTTNHLVGILPSLVVSQENTEQAALLLRYGEPARAEDYLRLELAGYVFYIDLAEAMSIEKRGAFTELLEALPPSAKLFQGTGESKWTEITPAQLARDRRLPLRPRTFQDVQASDFAREIQTLAAYQLLPGAGGSFRPKEALTREDFCVMAAGVLGLPEGDRGRFSDVDPSSSSAGPISAMAELGFLSGYQDGSFRPGRVMSCQELVTALSAIAGLGAASFFNQVAMMLVQIAMNNTLRSYGALSAYGSDIPIACVGIITKVNVVMMAFLIGIGQGCQPIIGFNYGAELYPRVRETFRRALTASLMISCTFFLCFQLFPRQILTIFDRNGSELFFQFGTRYFRIYMAMAFMTPIHPLTSSFFTSIGKAKRGMLLSLTRQILFLLPLIFLFSRLFGIDGVMFAGPIADGVAIVLAAVLLLREMGRIRAMEQPCQNTD